MASAANSGGRGLLAAFLASAACGPAPPAGGPSEAAGALGAVEVERLLADVAALAGPEMDGRRPGTAGNDRAVAFVAARFAALGLASAPGTTDFAQAVPFTRWTPGPMAGLEVDGLPVPFEGILGSAAGEVSGELAFVGYGITSPPFARADFPDCPLAEGGHDDYAGADVSGRLVVVLRGLPNGSSATCPTAAGLCDEQSGGACAPQRLVTKVRNAAAHGAAGVLLVARGDAPTAPVPLLGDPELGSPPTSPVLFADRAALAQKLPELDAWVRAADAGAIHRPTGFVGRLLVTATSLPGAVDNLLAVLPGVDPDPRTREEVVIVGAHLDHLGSTPWSGLVYPGADDNASGVAVLLELARLLASAPPPRRTLLFAAWNAEESGVLGSCHYVTAAPAYPLAQTIAAFSLDMVGRGDGSGLRLAGVDAEPPLPILSRMRDQAAARGYHELAVTTGPGTRSSDHVCFADAGVPAVWATTPPLAAHADYHSPADLPAQVTAANLAAAARLMHATLAAYAWEE